ncbi:MAG: phosphatase [Erysipelothrix sp.]|nr:phosphatase [Erysipelothrix sp.]
MIGIIDIGSNTIRLNVYMIQNNEFKIVFSSKEMAGLIGYVDKQQLSEKGIHKLIGILKDFLSILESLDISEVYPFATASLRNINNSQTVLQRVKDETGLTIDLIEAENEGILGFNGAINYVKVPTALLIDIGGGSTEIVPYSHYKIISSVSLPIGSLSLFKQYVKGIIPTQQEIKNMKKFVTKSLEEYNPHPASFNTLVGVGGTIRAIKKINAYLYDDNTITDSRFSAILETISDESDKARDIILKVVPDRIHTIVCGCVILSCLLKHYIVKEIVVSEYGAREGYLILNQLSK